MERVKGDQTMPIIDLGHIATSLVALRRVDRQLGIALALRARDALRETGA